MPEARGGPAASPSAPEPTPLEREWADTVVEVTSPSGGAVVRMVGDSDISLWLDPGWYARVAVSDLERDLAGAARLVYVERTRSYYDTWSRVAGHRIDPVRTPVSPEQETYLEGLKEIPAHGESYGGRVSLSMIGLSSFAVRIGGGVLDELDAASFAEVAREAALACFADHVRGWQRLHFEVYTRPVMARRGLM